MNNLQKKMKTNGHNKAEADKSADSSISEIADNVESSEDSKMNNKPILDNKNNELGKSSTDTENKSNTLDDSTNSDKTLPTENGTKTDVEVEPNTTEDTKSDMNMDGYMDTTENLSNNSNTEKCETCGQFLNNSDLIYYQGHPQDAVEEYIALTNEKLVLSSGLKK